VSKRKLLPRLLSAECVDALDRTKAAAMLKQIAAVRDDSSGDLQRRFGEGHWCGITNPDRLKREIKKGRQLYLVSSAGEPVATFAIAESGPKFLRPDWFTEPQSPAMYLTGLSVVCAGQGQGVGRWCMKFIRKNVASRGFKWLRFDAYDAPAGALDFYAKCGCAERQRFDFNGVALIAIEMKC
jgi:GNAT superfamily N-acetyltransferase